MALVHQAKRELQRTCRKLIRNSRQRPTETGAGRDPIAKGPTVPDEVRMIEDVKALHPATNTNPLSEMKVLLDKR